MKSSGASRPQSKDTTDYLRSIENHRRLTREEEYALSALVMAGNAASDRIARESLDPEDPEHAEEFEAAARGSEAERTLVECNLLLVVTHARKCFGSSTLDLLDLIQEGNLGLMKAAHRFDATKGYFGVFAGNWIRHHIQEGIARTGRTIYVPGGIQKDAAKIINAQREHGTTDVTVLAEHTGLKPQRIRQVTADDQTVLAFNPSHGDLDDNDAPAWLVVDDDLAENLSTEETRTAVRQRVAGLDWIESQVLNLHFGLSGEEPMTLAQVGEAVGLSVGRIHAIKTKALSRLRHPANGRHLRAYLYEVA